jgi:hypothetical protein
MLHGRQCQQHSAHHRPPWPQQQPHHGSPSPQTTRSAARKFGTRTRIQHTQHQRHANPRNQLQRLSASAPFISSNRLKCVDRASELATAAATPSSTSSVIRISFRIVRVSRLYSTTNLTNSRE